MKRPLIHLSLLSLALATQTALAQETFFGSLDSDVVFNNGVLLQGVVGTTDSSSTITLEGTGTLTVASSAGGGFPRLVVYGGTTITSERTFSTEEFNKTVWSGQFDAPSSSVKPDFFDINPPGAGFANDYEAVEAFGMGLSNELFKFSTEADFVFPAGQQRGQKLFLATQKDDGTWDVDKNTFCIVKDSLCSMKLASINRISLIKEKFETCPVQNIANGSVGPTPGCIYTCSSGFQLNEDATGCEASVTNEEFENSFEETTAEATTAQQQAAFNGDEAWAVPSDPSNWGDPDYCKDPQTALSELCQFPAVHYRPGHFRYRASGENMDRYLDETGLTATYDADGRLDPASEAGMARHVNKSYVSRNPRTAAEQLASQATNNTAADTAAQEESFVSYLIQMRNHFGSGAQENNYTAMSAEGGESTTETAEGGESTSTGELAGGDSEDGEFLSSGPLLPSTGPGLFVTIAVVGFALMMFGARRS